MLYQHKEMTMTNFLGWMPDYKSNGDFLCLKSVYLCTFPFQDALRVEHNILISYDLRRDPTIPAELLAE